MKHPSIWLAAVLLGGAPLYAMALDYVPNAPLLAEDTAAQQLPMPAARGAAPNDTVRSDVADTESDGADDSATADAPDPVAPAAQHITPSEGSAKPAAAHAASPVVSRKGHPEPTTHPATSVPAGTSWQSLLPGSIQ